MKTPTYNITTPPPRFKYLHAVANDIVTTDSLLTAPYMGATDEEICASIQKAKNYKDPEAKWSNPLKTN